MDVKLLKTLVDLSNDGNAVDDVDLFKHVPNNQSTLNNLKELELLGFINIDFSDDELECVSFNDKAFNYFK